MSTLGTHMEEELRSQPEMWRRAMDVAADRKSTRLNSSHVAISYAVFCLKKKKLHKFMRANSASEYRVNLVPQQKGKKRSQDPLTLVQLKYLLLVRGYEYEKYSYGRVTDG